MSRTKRRLVGGGVSLVLALCVTSAFAALSAAGATSQTSLPTTSTQWDPQNTNVPYLAWAGEQVRLEKCVAVPAFDNLAVIPDLSSVNATLTVEDWSGDPNFKPTIVDGANGTGSGTVGVFWSKSKHALCASGDLMSLYPGMAKVELDLIDANNILQFFGQGPGHPVMSHQFLAGWMILDPALTEMSSSNFASTAQSNAAAAMGDPTGDGQFVAGGKPGYMDVTVKGTIPMMGAWGQFLGTSQVTLPDDWAFLANKLAATDLGLSAGNPASYWDIMNDPANVLSHVPQSPTPCSPVPSQFASVPSGPAGTDTVDNCAADVLTGSGPPADSAFSTQFGIISHGSFGPFDPVNGAETLLPNGVLDWADAPMPAARIDVTITPNGGGSTDTTGVGYLDSVSKDQTYSRDFLGTDWNTTPGDLYAPYYDQYIPATSRPGDASSGIDGAAANNFNGFLVNGRYDNWDIAATWSTALGGASSCLRSAANPMIDSPLANPGDYYQLPSGPQSVSVYTDNHGEAQVKYVPGMGFYFNSLITSGAAITNANGGCDLQSLYNVPGGLGSATITATAKYPYKPVLLPDAASSSIVKQVASLWSKTIASFPKGAGTNNANARIVTTHAQGIDGSPFAGEIVCFSGDQNSQGIGIFQGKVGGTSYSGVQPVMFYPYAPPGSTCVTADANGNAAVEVLNSNATKVDVVAEFMNEGLFRDIVVDFGSGTGPTGGGGGGGTVTTTTTVPGPTTTVPGPTTTVIQKTEPGSTTTVISGTTTTGSSSTTAAASTGSAGTTTASTPAKASPKAFKPLLRVVRLVTLKRGHHYVLIGVTSTKATAKVRLAITQKITKRVKQGNRMVNKTTLKHLNKTYTIRTNRNVQLKMGDSVTKVTARLI